MKTTNDKQPSMSPEQIRVMMDKYLLTQYALSQEIKMSTAAISLYLNKNYRIGANSKVGRRCYHYFKKLEV